MRLCLFHRPGHAGSLIPSSERWGKWADCLDGDQGTANKEWSPVSVGKSWVPGPHRTTTACSVETEVVAALP